jgi:SAM-dependent methyltransferase
MTLMNPRQMISRGLATLGLRIQRLRPRPAWAGDGPRLPYQERLVTFPITPGDRVLDIGSGGYPFPLATVHMDRYPSGHWSRREPLARVQKPFVTGDIQKLPFHDKSFDFIYVSHVLQAVDDPLRACLEMMRVGRAGFIELPTLANSALFSWAKGLMKWHAVAMDNNICFFEYTDRQLEGVRSSIWRDLIMSPSYEPVQSVFYENMDIFNVMFPWTGSFSVFVFGRDGSLRTCNASPSVAVMKHERVPARGGRSATVEARQA